MPLEHGYPGEVGVYDWGGFIDSTAVPVTPPITRGRIVSIGSDYNVQPTDFDVLADATAGSLTLFLPQATGSGQFLHCKKIDGTTNVVTVLANGNDLIDDSGSVALVDQWSDCTMIDAATGYWDLFGSGP